MQKNQFTPIKEMLERAHHGLSFPMSTIVKVYSTLNAIANQKESFLQFVDFLYLLYQLSLSPNTRVLAGSSYAQPEKWPDEDRIMVVKQYIDDHFAENPTLSELADLVCMTPSSFSRYFKNKTDSTLSNYIIDVKLAYAVRLLLDTSHSIAEICYDCGFNNQSNFNRIFKSKKGQTPREFRASFRKNKSIV